LESISYLHLSWDDVDKLLWRAASQIMKDKFYPNLIIAVGRGGFDPARILCDQLSVRRLTCIQLESYSGIAEYSEPKIVIPLNIDVKKSKVLLTDDVSDSGRSLWKAREYILSQNPEELRVITLHVKPWTMYKPDYWVEETDKWIVYPWEINEIIKELSEKLGKNKTKNEVVAELIKMGFEADKLIRYF
jgi:hypothetical protein